jgi:ADP-ribose pyrophosphatase YjhB (NUDIX family)
MRQRGRTNRINSGNRRAPEQQTRLVVTALAETDNRLLLGQLARGPVAGFWLLPSATVEHGSVERTVRQMMPERTGYPVAGQQLVSVLEESKPELLLLRLVFRVQTGECAGAHEDREIAQVRWVTRHAVRQILTERDVVPNLGVMSLVRAWAEGTPLRPLETLIEDCLCPCGSGFRYPGCCGWDAK